MRAKSKIVKSGGKWWCFSGFWVGTAITPVLAWQAAENSRKAFEARGAQITPKTKDQSWQKR